MAGLTSSFSVKPMLCWGAKTASSSSSCLCSFESELGGVRLSNSNYLKMDYGRAVSGASLTLITARYGGGYRPGPGVSRRRGESSQSDFGADASLDVSNIRSTSVRLIDAEQNMVGIVSKSEAIQMAEDAELDLVILSPDADPPVVRIMDYKKYRYDQQKKKREQQKKSAASRMDVKELKMGYNIDSHDYSVRLKAAQKFLKDGDKVKAIVNLKGRENEFRNIAIELIRRFQNDIGELATEEAKSFRERNVFIVLAPNKALLQKAQEQPKKREKPSATEISAGV